MEQVDASPGDRVPPGAGWASQIRHFESPVLRMRYRGGVVINPRGLPEWDLLGRALVRLPVPEPGLTIDEVRIADVLTANEVMVGLEDPLWSFTADDYVARTPSGWVWAHRFGGRELVLMPAEAHGAFRHVGGVASMHVDRSRRGLRIEDPAEVPMLPADRLADGLLARLEDRLGYRLPPAYRDFLARSNGAEPRTPGVHPDYGFVVDQPFFGLSRADRHQDLVYASQWFGDRLTDGYLAVGYVQGGLLAVKVTGADSGSVWYWDDDDPRDDDRLDAAIICSTLLHRCADDFDDFLADLSAVPARLLSVVDHRVETGLAVVVHPPDLGSSLPAGKRASMAPPGVTGTPE